MKNKIIFKSAVFTLLLICLISCAAGMLSACNNEEVTNPRKVEIVLINPNTGEPMTRKEHIEEPPADTPIEVRIKDVETGEYLTDDDLPETTIEKSLSIGMAAYSDWDYTRERTLQNVYNVWPNREKLNIFYTVFKFSIMFDCRPRNPDNSDEFVRRYELTSMSFTFEYI